MKYVSTRSKAPALPFDDVLLAGLARDGGLYVPDAWPQFSADDIRALKGLPYAEQATRVMEPFLGGCIDSDDFAAMTADAYRGFSHPDVAPLKQLDETGDLWLMELFHGPTLAFKDYALQLVGRLFDHVLKNRGERLTIIGATSGDTGSAAIEACRDRDALEVFILHPRGRVSEVQRRQMTTVASPNIHNIAVEGSFDNCQNMVKAMFNDQAFRDRCRLGAVNSINWARIMAQISYYFIAGVKLGAPDRPVSFAVPTGNFGNVFAGYAASRMGLSVKRLVIGSNRNDILYRFLKTGIMETGAVHSTISPSMDIQISSNFERLLFDLLGRDGSRVTEVMDKFSKTGSFGLERATLDEALSLFDGERFDDEETKAMIRTIYRETGELLDPHTAVGVAAGRAAIGKGAGGPMIALATAHPAKFPDAVEEATRVRPKLPPHLADLLERTERLHTLPNDLNAVRDYISDSLR
ncbi:MAG: threonine synthase [Rhodospirillales bacterium RIFCSPLOWO2_12_FULL_58_28]|nr:MAG: threonine synthase [Rhodospirillales bacterium RIFCSPLOWO2_02_FULL_58_16]OHC78342.1 MAG: threonine synthase [Rhodospirillales bacterium RIFCSPLOWO2_12_FULL_58_28]